MADKDFVAGMDSNARKTPIRVAFVTRRTSSNVRVQDEERVMTAPFALLRIVVAMEVLALGLVLTALRFDAPLEGLADPLHTPNPAKAPWYFLGLQELVHYSALVGGVVVPTLLVLVLIVLPYVDRSPHGSGRWFAPERRVANSIFTAAVLVFAALTVIGSLFRGPNWAWVWPWK